ncbi:MAG TPA: response regulator [Gemmatimonadaceae bacterium]|nr:response regulator [Gemmatimonadaceae bacterium]
MTTVAATTRRLVVVVDDDESIRESVPDLLRQLGYDSIAFESAASLLASGIADRSWCLMVDVGMPVMSGPALMEELRRRHQDVPVILMTGQADERARVQLIESGAIDLLFKPFSEQTLLDAINKAPLP